MKADIKVEDLMDRIFLSFDPETPLREVVETLFEKRLFGACVADKNGKVLGIVSEKKCIDLYEEALNSRAQLLASNATVMDVLLDTVQTIPQSTGIFEAARIFVETDYRRIPVVDNGVLVGQITRRDILKAVNLLSG